MRRLSLVGTGVIAQAHAAAVATHADRATIVAAVDVDADRLAAFADKHAIPGRYGWYEDALDGAQDADVVVLCTPPLLHRSQAVRALERGLVVLCEKPPTLSLADLDEIIRVEQAYGGRFATVFQQRFGGGTAQLRGLAAAGALGRATAAVCHTLWFRPPEYFAVGWRGRWESEGGGPTMGHGIHQMDLLRYVLGPWREVTVVATRLARDTDTEDLSAALVTFDDGTVASVVNSLLSPRERSYLRFDFADATVELDHLYGYGDANWTATGAPGHEQEITELWRRTRLGTSSGHTGQLAAVLDALDGVQAPPVTSADARETVELIAAIYASAFTRRPVRRGEVDRSSPFYTSMAGPGAPWPARPR